MSAPVAIASIQLSEEERKRIAGELGIDASDMDSIPTKLDIAKYEVEDDAESDVEGFAFNPSAMSFQSQTFSSPGALNLGPMMKVGKVNKFLLVAV